MGQMGHGSRAMGHNQSIKGSRSNFEERGWSAAPFTNYGAEGGARSNFEECTPSNAPFNPQKDKLAPTFSLAILNQFESSKLLGDFNSENSNLPLKSSRSWPTKYTAMYLVDHV